jgi:hypothetical protein
VVGAGDEKKNATKNYKKLISSPIRPLLRVLEADVVALPSHLKKEGALEPCHLKGEPLRRRMSTLAPLPGEWRSYLMR